jgi:hypothetical protein
MAGFFIMVSLGSVAFAVLSLLLSPVLRFSVNTVTHRQISYSLAAHIAVLSTVVTILISVTAAYLFREMILILPLVPTVATAFFIRDLIKFEQKVLIGWPQGLMAAVFYELAVCLLGATLLFLAGFDWSRRIGA